MASSAQHYNCKVCNFRTTLLSRIQNHLLVHADTKPSNVSYFDCFEALKPLMCSTCGFSTESLVFLRYHFVHHHDQQQFTLKATLKTCKECSFYTHSNYLWIRHDMFGSCKGKRTLKEKRKRQRVLRKMDGKWFLCENCDFRTVHSKSLKKHIIYKHTPLEEIDWQQCMNCPAKFKTRADLKQHQKFHSSAVDYLYCPKCSYSTPIRQNLVRHLNGKHARPDEIKWEECQECGVKFKYKNTLKFHMKMHTTKEKQYKCDQCPFKSHQQGTLKRHVINRHLKDEEIKWYNCQHCDYKGKNKDVLNKHIRYMHSESLELLQCPHCSFKTKRKVTLQRHVARFHDDSAFKCDLCDYRDKYEKYIIRHKKIKHGVGDVEWFRCEHCNFKTKYKGNLKNHVLAKHNKD